MLEQTTPPGEWLGPLTEFAAYMSASKTPAKSQYLRTYHVRRFALESGLAPYTVHLEDLIDHLHRNASWSASTARCASSSLKAFYRWARLTGHVTEDPSANLPKIRLDVGKPRPAPVSAISKAERDHDWRVRLMVSLAAYAGLRCCEIAQVHSDDIVEDFVGWSLRVHGKGRKERMVPLRGELVHLLQQLPDGFAFPGNDGGHLSAAYVSKLVSRSLPDGVTAHQLRHSFASRAYRASGNDIRAVQELLGHASVATTQIYTAVDPDALRRAVVF